MKIHRRAKALFPLLFLCAGALFADRTKSEEFLTLIGVKPQSDLYSQLISIYVQYNPNRAIPLNYPEQSSEVSRIVDEAITGVDYFSRVVQGFALIYDEKRIAPYESWARTATGKRIVKMEMDSGSILLSKTKISRSGRPGYRVKISILNGMMTILNDIYVIRNRMIQVVFSGPAYAEEHPSVRRFFSTFLFLE